LDCFNCFGRFGACWCTDAVADHENLQQKIYLFSFEFADFDKFEEYCM
jgi:hypothetical protein